MNGHGLDGGIPFWSVVIGWLLGCAIRGWFKGFWHQLALPVALLVFITLHFSPLTDRFPVIGRSGLGLSLLVFCGWKWLSSEWPKTNDEPSLPGRRLLGLGGAGMSVVIGAGFVWLVLLLVGLGIVRSAIATRLDGFTIDEAYHIAAGVSYGMLDVDGLDRLRGSGVYYSATNIESRLCRSSAAHVVGGGNRPGTSGRERR